MFTKGEAEAKALALRAEAYRQFNEAAIIQTVLSMLPEIVRAAAEPMATSTPSRCSPTTARPTSSRPRPGPSARRARRSRA